MAFSKLLAFTKKVADLADQPTLTPTELKAQFDAAPDEVRVYFNNLVDGLKLTTSGDSGAKNIGASTIVGLTGNDVQTLLAALNSNKAGKTVEAWQPITLMNSWVVNGGTTTTPGYRKDDLGIVHLKGSIKLGTVTAGTQIFTLPTGYQPPEVINNVPVLCEDGSGVIYGTGYMNISNSGGVFIYVPSATTRIYFNNIRFFTY